MFYHRSGNHLFFMTSYIFNPLSRVRDFFATCFPKKCVKPFCFFILGNVHYLRDMGGGILRGRAKLDDPLEGRKNLDLVNIFKSLKPDF